MTTTTTTHLEGSNLVRGSVLALVAALVVGTLFATTASAAPPGGPPPAGTIYFEMSGTPLVHRMLADGSNKTPLGCGPGRPSRLPHGSKRWFLRLLVVEPREVNIWGGDQWDIFALREDGAVSVRLTNDPVMDYLELNGLDWAPGENASEALVSGLARRWTPDGQSVVPGTAGVYTAALRFNAAGDVIGLDAQPAFLVSLGVVEFRGGEFPAAHTFSWSPDRTKLVADRFVTNETEDSRELRIVDVASGVSATLVQAVGGYGSTVGFPQWSPSGSTIAFHSVSSGTPQWAIEVVSPLGTGRTIVKRGRKMMKYPRWSPDSAYLVYQRLEFNPSVRDIFRISVTGSGETNLTNDTTALANLIDWR